MLKFFRENAVFVGWIIVIFFGLTMFAGSVFLGFNDQPQPQRRSLSSEQQQFAVLGEYPLSIKQYNQFIQVALQNIPDVSMLSPLQLEPLKLRSFNQVVESQLFYIAALEEGLELSKAEYKKMEAEFLLESDFKNKSDLKKKLKENGVKYSVFKEDISREFLIRKIKMQLSGRVNINQEVVDDSFKSFKYDVVLISTANIQSPQVIELATEVSNQLNDDISLDQLKANYNNELELSFVEGVQQVSYLDLNVQFREALINLQVGEYSAPLFEEDLCVIIRLINIDQRLPEEGYDEQEYSEFLTAKLQEQELSNTIQQVFSDHALNIFEPSIKAAYYKARGDYETALLGYEKLETLDPSSTVPNYYKAELLFRMGNFEKAETEIKTAALKAKFDERYDFPEIYLLYGDMFMSQLMSDDALTQYRMVYDRVIDNAGYLGLLQGRYQEYGFDEDLEILEEQIALLESQQSTENIKIAE